MNFLMLVSAWVLGIVIYQVWLRRPFMRWLEGVLDRHLPKG